MVSRLHSWCQATMEVLVQLQTAVCHKRLVALRATPRLPQFGRRGLRKRRTNCRSTCPVGWVSLQVDNSGAISSVYLHNTHLCDTLHSKPKKVKHHLHDALYLIIASIMHLTMMSIFHWGIYISILAHVSYLHLYSRNGDKTTLRYITVTIWLTKKEIKVLF